MSIFGTEKCGGVKKKVSLSVARKYEAIIFVGKKLKTVIESKTKITLPISKSAV